MQNQRGSPALSLIGGQEFNTQMVNTIKENWLKKDTVCPCCNQVTEQVRGITKQNLRKLLIPKWDATEVTITLLLITLIILSFAYKNETQQCRDWVGPMYANDGADCLAVCDNKCSLMKVAIGGSNNEFNFNITNTTNPE